MDEEDVFDTFISEYSLTITQYYWRVCSINGSDTSSWSDIWNFTILGCGSLNRLYLKILMQGNWNSSIQTQVNCPITVEFRQGSSLMNSSVIYRKASIIGSNGIIFLDCSDVQNGFYWIIARSAGYMPLAIPSQIYFPICSSYYWDFTYDSTQAVGGNRVMIKTAISG